MDADFTSDEVSRLAGFKKRWMLEHLEREKIFIREKSADRSHGRRRKYTFGDLLILRAINRMLELGARPARIREVINSIREVEGFPTTRTLRAKPQARWEKDYSLVPIRPFGYRPTLKLSTSSEKVSWHSAS